MQNDHDSVALLDRLVYALKVQYPSYTEHPTATGIAAVDEACRLGYGHRP